MEDIIFYVYHLEFHQRYQKRISRILEGLKGVTNHTDDILVWGTTRIEHDSCLQQVFKRLMENKVTLNKNKCIFDIHKAKFLRHVINTEGIISQLIRIKSTQQES